MNPLVQIDNVQPVTTVQEEIVPTTAYDLLEPKERECVDEYLTFVLNEQARRGERIIHALSRPIPSEYVRRSKGILHRPLVRAALAEKIREASAAQDISPDNLIREYNTIATSKMSDFVENGGFGDVMVKSFDEIGEEKMGAVKSIESKPGRYGMQVKVVLHDKLPAMNRMAEFMGLIAPERPILRDYTTPTEGETGHQEVEDHSEEAYSQLLEDING